MKLLLCIGGGREKMKGGSVREGGREGGREGERERNCVLFLAHTSPKAHLHI